MIIAAAIIGATTAAVLLQVSPIIRVVLVLLGSAAGLVAGASLTRSSPGLPQSGGPPQSRRSDSPPGDHHSVPGYQRSPAGPVAYRSLPGNGDSNGGPGTKPWWDMTAWRPEPPSSSTRGLDVGIPHRAEGDPTARVAQCPRCACFRIEAIAGEPLFAFECRDCSNEWEWRPGTAWPTTRRLSRQLYSPQGNLLSEPRHTDSGRLDV